MSLRYFIFKMTTALIHVKKKYLIYSKSSENLFDYYHFFTIISQTGYSYYFLLDMETTHGNKPKTNAKFNITFYFLNDCLYHTISNTSRKIISRTTVSGSIDSSGFSFFVSLYHLRTSLFNKNL